MTTNTDVHTCSYYCERPGCIRAQRDELVAKVEALRAEMERLRADRDSWEQQASDRVADWHAEHLRAERLAEALALLPDEIVMVEHNPYEGPLMFCCGQRVTLSWHHGLIPTHDKKCWYARMRALRDHDQEDRNG